jgi:ribonuclease D
MNDIQFIDTADDLHELCQAMKKAPWLAMDTEFLRETTYYPKFCLLQIATLDWVACIDPIALEGKMDELFGIINDPTIIKIMHSCHQDVEIFYQLSGQLPQPIYDTQLVAPLLGYQENPGYAMLVSGFLNINLSKIQTRTDWSQRPLSTEQIKYAADDVIYLAKIYCMMEEQLKELGRENWLKEDFEKLLNPDLYDIPAEKAWLKIRGKNKLTGKQLAIVQVLAEWREKAAKKSDKPKNWIVRDEHLVDMAKLQPTTVRDLSKIRGVTAGFIRRSGQKICELIAIAQDLPTLKVKTKAKSGKKNQKQEAILDILSGIVRLRASENSLNPIVLATRKDLEAFIEGNENCVVLNSWRYIMVGEELQHIVQGKKSITVSPSELWFHENTQEN